MADEEQRRRDAERLGNHQAHKMDALNEIKNYQSDVEPGYGADWSPPASGGYYDPIWEWEVWGEEEERERHLPLPEGELEAMYAFNQAEQPGTPPTTADKYENYSEMVDAQKKREKDNKKRAKDRAFWEKEDALLREVQEDMAQRERDRKRQARGEGPSNQDFPFK